MIFVARYKNERRRPQQLLLILCCLQLLSMLYDVTTEDRYLVAALVGVVPFLGDTHRHGSSSRNLHFHKDRMNANLRLMAKTQSSEIDLLFLKQELTSYLEKRKEVGADEKAKESVGTIVGGTKGNKVLEYVSGAPNKAQVIEEPPNPFDYDELTKYGYGHLVAKIMDAGGRNTMYTLLGMDVPISTSIKRKQVTAPPLIIDRTGERDPARYQGLRLGQILDDEAQARALQEVQQKIANGERPSSSQVWEQVQAYEQPFADRRNVGPVQTSDWTVEKLDEWGRQQGRVQSWARAAAEGAFVKDPAESTDSMDTSQRVYSIITILIAALTFGKATPGLLNMMNVANGEWILKDVLSIPAACLVLTSLGSCIFCSAKASTKNRSGYIWAVKGFLGGPFTVRQLVDLPALITKQELRENQNVRQE